MSFRITGLPSERFTHLFELPDEELALQGAVRRIADSRTPGYPCRVSLTDSREGDELLLVNYEHHPVHSPYRMRFAIYVRKGEETYDAVDQVPEQFERALALTPRHPLVWSNLLMALARTTRFDAGRLSLIGNTESRARLAALRRCPDRAA
jgi:hypothetical protein